MRIVTILLFLAFGVFAQGQNTILGKWKSIDDETGKPRSFVEIYQNSNGQIEGKISELIREPGDDPNPTCDECAKDDPRHGKPVKGMVIITKMNLAGDKKSAKGGKILDPENGNVYGCILTLDEVNKTLKVRGYLGFAALGRTQIWQRAN